MCKDHIYIYVYINRQSRLQMLRPYVPCVTTLPSPSLAVRKLPH